MKDIEKYLPMVLFIMRCKMVLRFEYVDEIVQYIHSNATEQYFPVYGKIPVISPGLLQVRKGFGWAYKWGKFISGGLKSGIKNLFPNERITNKSRLTYRAIQIRFPFTYVFRL